MKRITTVLSVGLLLFFCSSVFAQNVSEKRHYKPRVSLEKQAQGIAGALEFYKIIRGTPDVSDIVSAHKQADLLPKGKSLTWQNIGPDNMGGRTRAILEDRSTPTTLYAGGVAGGLWKSVTGGTSWELIAPLAENYAVSCITQDINGYIYFGTGEGFGVVSGSAAGSTSFVGGGIYKSADATGNSFAVLPATEPSSISDKWAFIYEMASHPTIARVYAATDGGLYMTEDGGTTWTNPVLYPNTSPYNVVAHDVEIGSNGCVYAIVGDKVFYSPDGTTGSFVDRSIGGTSASLVGRIEIAVAPSNPNYIYAVVARQTGNLMNVYRSTDAGVTWSIIGPGGSANFNLFGDNNQGYWDNIVKVFPNDENHIIVGGIDLWDWYDGGTWIQKSLWYLDPASAYYLHADHHDIVFSSTDPDMFYHGSDGGVSKSTDGGGTFSTVNRNFTTIQYYSLSCNLFDQVLGGTQDNGTILIPNIPNQPKKATEFLGGDGGWTAMSYINPNVIVGTIYYGDLYRSEEFGGNPQQFYNQRILDIAGEEFTSSFAGFVTPMLLDEDLYDDLSTDSVYYHADSAVSAGTTVTVPSHNNFFPFQYTLPVSVAAGDSLLVQDPISARFYLGGNGAVWMTKGVHKFGSAPDWYKIATISGTSQCLAVSDDGNYLFVGTTSGNLYRISNLDYVADSITGDVTSAYCVVETKLLASTGRSITSISVDPTDANNVLYTLGEYGQTAYVYYSTNALDQTPTFSNKTGTLPKLPVYASVIELHNPNTVIIGTELGVFTTSNITAASPSWVEDNAEMGRVPVYMLRQQTLNYPLNTNYGVIYAASHGRGAFKTDAYVGIGEIEAGNDVQQVGCYPNPAADFTRIVFNSPEAGAAIINLYSADGKLVLSQSTQVHNGTNQLNLNVSTLSSGNYIIEVALSEGSLSGKLMKN